MKFGRTTTTFYIAALLLIGSCNPALSSPRVEAPLTIAFGSCIKSADTPLWAVAHLESPDLLFLLGDNVYFNEGKLKKLPFQDNFPGAVDTLLSYYRDLFDNKAFTRLVGSVPTFATWDDHDFGLDDGDSSFKGRRASFWAYRAAFEELHRRSARQLGASVRHLGWHEGIAFAFIYRNVQFIVTDNRSYRVNPTTTRAGKQKNTTQHFSKKQLRWIEHKLNNPDVAATFIVSGGQLLSEKKEVLKNEQLKNFHEEFNSFHAVLQRSPHPVYVLSGDRHYSEVLKVKSGNRYFLEFTSSPISSGVRKKMKNFQDPNRIGEVVLQKNIGIITVSSETDDTIRIRVKYIGDDGLVLYRHSFDQEAPKG